MDCRHDFGLDSAVNFENSVKHENSDLQLYGYDTEKYPITYGNGLYEEDIFEVLSTYARLYFIYVIESSLIVSNYSVRETNEQISLGNFPLWNLSFFGKETGGRFSHILDFDTLRLGRKVIENNKNAGSFEFGLILITEIGKDRLEDRTGRCEVARRFTDAC